MNGVVDIITLASGPPTGGEFSLLVLIFLGPSLLAVVGLILAFRGRKRAAIAMAIIGCFAAMWMRGVAAIAFGIFLFVVCDLFRISGFGFRIWSLCGYVATWL